jgi:hypothetical protein
VGIVQTRADVGNGSSKPASQLGSTSRGFRGTTNVLVLNSKTFDKLYNNVLYVL